MRVATVGGTFPASSRGGNLKKAPGPEAEGVSRRCRSPCGVTTRTTPAPRIDFTRDERGSPVMRCDAV
jgi:hypothetical protein